MISSPHGGGDPGHSGRGTAEIDINCDCGEGFGRWTLGDDEAVMEHVTSVNLACGFHAGDPVTMLTAVRRAKDRGVAIGAHPGLPDLLGFGRRVLDWKPEEGFASVAYQVGALRGLLDANEAELHHVKLHGVLPAMVARDEPLAAAIVAALEKTTPGALLYSPASKTSHYHRLAREAGFTVIEEVYADMRYDEQGENIVEREKLPMPPDEAADQIRRYLRTGMVRSVSGAEVPIQAQSVSFHGDAPNALEIAEVTNTTVRSEGTTPAAPNDSSPASEPR